MKQSSGEGSFPITGTNRIEVLDILRGFALLGILFVNVPETTLHYIHTGTASQPLSGVNAFFRFLYDLFIQTKFYTIFSFLFGVGFYIFSSRAQAHGLHVRRLYLRRLILMFLFGLCHIAFIWYGDVLYIYAIIGLFLLFFYQSSPRFLFILASLLMIVAMWPAIMQMGAFPIVDSQPIHAEYPVSGLGRTNPINQVSYTLIIGLPTLFSKFMEIFSLFLFGLWAGKVNLFQRIDQDHHYIRIIQWVSLLLSVLLWLPIIVYYLNSVHYFSANVTAWVELSGKTLAVFYITSVMLLWQQGRFPHLFSWFRDVGKMALTNYIMQSFLFNILIGSMFVSLGVMLSYTQAALMCVILFAVQIVVSRWWVRRFQFGPLEWLWRCGTYR